MREQIRKLVLAFTVGACVVWLLWGATQALAVEPINLARTNPYVAGAGVAAGCTTFPCTSSTQDGCGNTVLMCEDFEGSGSCYSGDSNNNCRITWSVDSLNTVNTKYATSPAPFGGSYSLYLDDVGEGDFSKSGIWADASEAHAYFRIRLGEASASEGETVFAAGFVPNDDYIFSCGLAITKTSGVSYWSAQNYGNSHYEVSSSITADNTVYHVWIDFVANTSCDLYLSTTSTKPGSPSAHLATFSSTVGTHGFRLKVRSAVTSKIILDNILVQATTIGSQ